MLQRSQLLFPLLGLPAQEDSGPTLGQKYSWGEGEGKEKGWGQRLRGNRRDRGIRIEEEGEGSMVGFILLTDNP